MKKIVLLCSVALFSMQAHAVSITMEGDYIKTAVSDDGTLGYGGTTTPGIQHDAAGTGSFGVDDYLTPGAPHEGFSVSSDQTGVIANDNHGSDAMTGTLTDTSGSSSYDQSVNWLTTYSDLFTMSMDTFFNDGDERISMSTTITALSDLTNLEFSRWLDPDPDVNTFGSYDTVNGRGYGDLAAEDWVHSEGTETGLTIGLYSTSDTYHNTGISSGWSEDPSFYLSGQNDGNGDYTIGLAFLIGELFTGQSVTLDYSYIMGDSLASVDIPSEVPVPAALFMFAPALLGFMGFRRRAKNLAA